VNRTESVSALLRLAATEVLLTDKGTAHSQIKEYLNDPNVAIVSGAQLG
jgi:hypothetical protein